jgi:hypothetical protein
MDGTLDKIAAISVLLDNANAPLGRDLTDNFEVSGLRHDDFVAKNGQDGAQSLVARAAAFSDELWSLAILVSNNQPSTTAFDSLVSAGELGILQDEALARSLQEYRQLTAALLKAQEVTFRPSRDSAIEVGLDFGLSPFRGVEKNELLALVADNPKLAATIHTQLGWPKDT